MDLEKFKKQYNERNQIYCDIKKASQDYFDEIYSYLAKLGLNNVEVISIKEHNESNIKIKFFNYDIWVVLEERVALPTQFIKNTERQNIKFYTGCINFYMIDSKIDENICILVDRMYINKNKAYSFDNNIDKIGFRNYSDNVGEMIIMHIFNKIFCGFTQSYLPFNEVKMVPKDMIKNQVRTKIGFKN